MVLGTFIFAQSLHVGLQSGQSGRTKETPYQGPSNGAVALYDAGFLASAEAVGLSQVSKMLRQLTWQILAHHSFTSFSFGPRTTYCTFCLELCKCWQWILDLFVSSSRMAFDKGPYRTLSFLVFTIHCFSEWCPQKLWFVVSFLRRWQQIYMPFHRHWWTWILQI